MQRTFRITVDGRSYNVVVEDLTAPAQPGAPQPASAPAASVVPAAAPSAAAPAPAAASPVAVLEGGGAGAEVAPLAGVVVAIDAHVGQAVKPGDRIATIEAMKMKTFVLAKNSGTVTTIAVKPNDSVETGQVLMTLG
ncbi:Biotin/lipoyl-binding protein [Rhodovastum atsumiense]|uniref:Biotin/lipoyl-binding protein n=1 Tax=Rhodovastum atsumiense TaxID=504468 RepID=A0A5M6IMP0_9PROT|nr:biotin/lipoyl-containing protein [Rhodovastum atsumiense]KAA5609516.1 biotin/lipoyl-binding protein [Rhodovastum atsumiense]CAH2600777.1 Biotin/lipoyl-binding protein [Rhodovastum atsumiense]